MLLLQLRTFRIHYARAMHYNAILAKLLEEEANEMGPSKDRDLELARVRTIFDCSYGRQFTTVVPSLQIFDGLGWIHYAKALRRWLPRNYPKNCQPF